MSLKYMVVPATNFKMDSETGLFTAYANTKNFIDHVKDRAVDGCYLKSIEKHKSAKTMPKMFWSHNPYELPVGVWKTMLEDSKGLLMGGKVSQTTMGKDIEILAKDGGLDSFSIGYEVIEEKWNQSKGCNDLLDIHVKEVSWVNFACNEESLLQEMKSALKNGQLPTRRELEKLLREAMHLSKSQAQNIVARYDDSPIETKSDDIFDLMAKLPQ
tara:strand:- start:36975 stop:37616 length:642 start_codon:yes stop_codon:yes gene_type:complete